MDASGESQGKAVIWPLREFDHNLLPDAYSPARAAGKALRARSEDCQRFRLCHGLVSQCVMGDPSSVKYAKAYLDNLRKKYKNNRKGSPLAMFKERASRKAMRTASSRALVRGHRAWPQGIDGQSVGRADAHGFGYRRKAMWSPEL